MFPSQNSNLATSCDNVSQLEYTNLSEADLIMERLCEDIKLEISEAINFGVGSISSCQEDFPATYRLTRETIQTFHNNTFLDGIYVHKNI